MTCDLRHLIKYYCETICFRLCVYKWAPIYLAIVYAMLVRQWSRTSAGCKSLHFAITTQQTRADQPALKQRYISVWNSLRSHAEMHSNCWDTGGTRVLIEWLSHNWHPCEPAGAIMTALALIQKWYYPILSVSNRGLKLKKCLVKYLKKIDTFKRRFITRHSEWAMTISGWNRSVCRDWQLTDRPGIVTCVGVSLMKFHDGRWFQTSLYITVLLLSVGLRLSSFKVLTRAVGVQSEGR